MANYHNKKNPAKKTTSAPLKEEKKTVESPKGFFERNNTLINVLFFILVLALYSNTLKFGYVMDDGAMITDNKTVKQGISAIPQLFKESSVYGSTGENFGTYRPLVMVMFAIEYDFFDGKPFMPHLINVLFYGLCCVVIYQTLRRFLKNYHPFLPLIATLLFTLHPLHTEVVANIKSRDEIMSMLFLFSSAFFLFNYFETKSTKAVLFSWIFFTCALFSKESAITFLVIIPLLFYFFTEVNFKKVLIACSPFVLASIVYLIARDNVLDPITTKIPVINNVMAEAKSAGEKYGTISFIMFQYLKNLVWPTNLSFDYGYAHITVKQFTDPIALATFLFILVSGVFALWKFKSKNLVAFGILFYLVTLSVSSNVLVMIAATMADRFLFVPSLAFTLLLGYGIVAVFKLSKENANELKWIAFAPVLIIGIFFSLETYSRNFVWESNYTLFKSGLTSAPNSYRTNRAFAVENLVQYGKEQDTLKKKVLLKDMITYYAKAMQVYPKNADDCFNMAICYYYNNQLDSAEKWYLNCVAINQGYINAHYNLAMIYSNRKDHDNAIKYFKEVKKLNPNFMDTNFKLGLHYHYKSSYADAIPYYTEFMQSNPNNYDVLNNLSLAYLGTGDKEKYAYFQRMAIAVKPNVQPQPTK